MILFLFEIGYILQHLAIIFQIFEIRKKKNTEGISIETLSFFFIALICRLYWFKESVLSKYYLFYIELPLAIISILGIFYVYNKYKIYDYVKNNIKLPFLLSFPFLLVIIIVTAYLLNHGKTLTVIPSIAVVVSLNIFLECIGILPQLFYIRKGSETGNISIYYLAFLLLARFFRIFFWIKMHYLGKSYFHLISADIFHTALLGYYIFIYTRNKDTISLPQFSKYEMKDN